MSCVRPMDSSNRPDSTNASPSERDTAFRSNASTVPSPIAIRVRARDSDAASLALIQVANLRKPCGWVTASC